MAPRSALRLLPAVPLVLLTAACDDDAADGSDHSGGTRPQEAVIAKDARMAWAADVEPDWDATDAIRVGNWVLVATKWSLEEDSSVLGLDVDTGEQWWEEGPGYGSFELTLLDDGTVRACDDVGGKILDPASGDVQREATAEECPEDFDGADTTADDVYEVDGSELVVYDDLEHSQEQYRIVLRDDDAVAWGVEGGVVTYSAASHEVRMYR